jgi:SAM-dependent methyltransferase
MRRDHFDLYFSDRYSLKVDEIDDATGEIMEGGLLPTSAALREVAIRKGVPRFVSRPNYADNFGLQWNAFGSTQLDSVSKLPITADRLWANTKWSAEEMKGKSVLEVGSGAGRFTEVLLQSGARVVSLDYSSAVDANYRNNVGKGDLLVFQGDVYDLPLKSGLFDFVLCYGVLQHTPDSTKAYKCIFEKLKSGGRISVDHYRRRFALLPVQRPNTSGGRSHQR